MAYKFADKTNNKDPNSVMIVDALNLAFRWKHSGAKQFVNDYIMTVQSLARSYDCAKIIIASDLGASSYRKEIFPEYKGNRQKLKEEQTEKEKQDFKDFLEEFNKTLQELERTYPVLRYQGVEADDIAAYLVKEREKFGFTKVWLISSDRDWDLLIRDDVARFSYVTRKEVTEETWEENYAVPPELYSSFKCLTGDKGDNVPGVDGIGPVKAAKLIEQYGDAIDLHACLPIESKYKYIQKLNEFGDQLLVNFELMDLMTYCEEAIGQENIEDIDRRLLSEA